VALWAAVFVALLSGVDYFRSFWRENARSSKSLDAA
jgi:hypothetical protein